MARLRRVGAKRMTFGDFCRDESGAILAFILPLFVTMLLGGGAAIDFMRHEELRARLQDSVDRGVLAAASLGQTVDSTQVVREYMLSAGFGPDTTLYVVPQVTQSNRRRILAAAEVEMETTFLKLAGIDSLWVAAEGTAEEGRRDLEVSLVLDFSTSMIEVSRFSTESKIDLLVPAAQTFIDTVLTADTQAQTSINLVPYAGSVNIKPIIDRFAINPTTRHSDNNCIELNENIEFGQTGLPNPRAARDQVPFFQFSTWSAEADVYANWGWCPTDDAAIVVQSNDAATLKARIGSLRRGLHEATGTMYGMKWALALLDPASRADLANASSAEFRNTRPLAWDPDSGLDGTSKVIVLMTDGKITLQYRPNEATRGNPNRMRQLRDTPLSSFPAGGNNGWRETRSSESQNRDRFDALCQLARDNNVRVFTITFDVEDEPGTDDVYDQMKDCATFESDFFPVEGTSISAAFNAIAAQISKLKLVN